jgi:hypothetical protein
MAASTAEDVFAVVILAQSLLRTGSDIDVFSDGVFWEARIVAVKRNRFRFRFLHTGNRCGVGWVRRRDFLVSWRFPVRVKEDVWKATLMAQWKI